MARKLTVPATVTVFTPAGKAESHTRANARDLVNGAGYTWEKKKVTTPAGIAPYALPQNTMFTKSKAQEVLDRVAPLAGDTDSASIVDTVVDESSDYGEDEATGESVDEIEEAQEAPRTRRRRQPKAE